MRPTCVGSALPGSTKKIQKRKQRCLRLCCHWLTRMARIRHDVNRPWSFLGIFSRTCVGQCQSHCWRHLNIPRAMCLAVPSVPISIRLKSFLAKHATTDYEVNDMCLPWRNTVHTVFFHCPKPPKLRLYITMGCFFFFP